MKFKVDLHTKRIEKLEEATNKKNEEDWPFKPWTARPLVLKKFV